MHVHSRDHAFMPPPDDVDPVAHEVFHAFKTAMHLQHRLMLRMLAEEGAHPAQAGCLRLLAESDGISQRDVAEHLGVSAPSVTSMLQKMEAGQIIERRADEHDQRITRIYITGEGREIIGRLHGVYAQALDASLGSLSEDDRVELGRLLGCMIEGMTRALAAHEPATSDQNEGDSQCANS